MTTRHSEIILSEAEFRRLLRGNVKLKVTSAVAALAFALAAGFWAAEMRRLVGVLVSRSAASVQIPYFNNWATHAEAANPGLKLGHLFQPEEHLE